jgi:hypothetical protein
VASATAVAAVGTVVGVVSSNTEPNSSVADAVGPTLLADIPSGSHAQTISDNIATQADAQKAAADAARIRAAAAATARADAGRAAAAKAAQASRDAAAAASRASARATLAKSYSPGSLQALAQSIIGDPAQFQCFSNIVTRESGWDYTASNGSGAYGLVQAMPGDKMASAGADWRTNPATQIKWGLGYMNSEYHSPCGAWAFWRVHHGY